MRPHPRLRPVTNGTDLQVHCLQTVGFALDLRQILVAAHHLGGRQPVVRLAGAQNVEAVQSGLPGDPVQLFLRGCRSAHLLRPYSASVGLVQTMSGSPDRPRFESRPNGVHQKTES